MDNSETKKYSMALGSAELTVEINALAEQANGAALVRYGDTMILATAVMSEQEKENMGFFPLMVDYEEKYYAAGKIKGPGLEFPSFRFVFVPPESLTCGHDRPLSTLPRGPEVRFFLSESESYGQEQPEGWAEAENHKGAIRGVGFARPGV